MLKFEILWLKIWCTLCNSTVYWKNKSVRLKFHIKMQSAYAFENLMYINSTIKDTFGTNIRGLVSKIGIHCSAYIG